MHAKVLWSGFVLASVALVLAMPGIAVGDIIATETFSYTDGQSLYGQAGGTGWSAIWTGNGMDVVSGQAVGSVLGNPPLYGSRNFNNPENEEWLFISVDLTTPSFGADDYFAVSTGTGVNNTQITFGKRPGSPYFEVGNGGWSSTGIPISPNTTYRLIGAYQLRATAVDTLLLWVNPTAADYLDINTGENSADVSRLDFVSLHAGYVSIYGNLPGTAFDNLVISNSPGGVGLGSVAVPEPSAIGVLFAATIAGAGWRRRRVGIAGA